jgi:alkylmercury lyase
MTDPADLDRFTRGSIASRQCRLSPPLQGLHRAVLRRFLQTGAAPTARWVGQTAADLGLPGSAARELEAADAIRIVNGIVAVAYPFSGVPTRHLAELDGLPAVYAMCAIDALGLPYMTGRDGRITSADPHDGAPSWCPSATAPGPGPRPAPSSSSRARPTAAPTAAPLR